MKNILVTGGAGFIGFHTVESLLSRGDHVVIIDNFNGYYDPRLKIARINVLKDKYKHLKIYKVDIQNVKAVERVFKNNKFDKICHLAAQAGVRYSTENPLEYERSNCQGTITLLEMAHKYGIKDFVFASSSSVYGNDTCIPFNEIDSADKPVSVYAATKRAVELYAHAYHKLYGMNCTGLRFFTVYGSYGRPDMAYFKFTKNIIEGKPIEVYHHGMRRDFTHIKDITQGILAAIDTPLGYEIFNLGNHTCVELKRFISVLEKTIGKKAIKKHLPMQKGDVPMTYADIRKAGKILGYHPKISIEEGLAEFVKWYKEFYK